MSAVSKLDYLNRIAPKYCDLMEEVKRRHAVINDVFEGNVKLPQIVAQELCYLELRKMCELIAIGCVLAHGDLRALQSKVVQRAYKPDYIMKSIERYHRDFFPEPTRQIQDSVPGKVKQIARVEEGYLTRQGLLALYAECGAQLHSGSARSILSGKQIPVDFSKIATSGKQIATLLNQHRIRTLDPDWELWVQMHAQDGKVHAYTMMRAKQLQDSG